MNENDSTTDVRDWFCTPDAQNTIHKPSGQVNATLARGAFGEVSIAIHTLPGKWRFLAVKSIVVPGASNKWGLPSTQEEKLKLPREVFNEICALRLLNPHPNIVELKAVYPSSGSSVSLAFNYCPTDLYTTLEWRRRTLLPPLSVPVLKGISYDLVSALKHCHARGCLHLDVKPGNLLVKSSGIIQLCDFGLAQPYNPGQTVEEEQSSAKGMCTLYYRPPELLLGSLVGSPAVDMYSAGLVISELIAGFPIFRGGNVLGQLAATFDVLGTPREDTWPTVVDLPDYGKLQFTPKAPQPLETVLPRAMETPSLLRLLEQLVVLDPSKRLSAEAALQQDWLLQESGVERSLMQAELIPEALQEPILLSNPNQDLSIASQKSLALASVKRGFLKSLHSWKDPKSSKVPSLEARCNSLCPGIINIGEV